MAPQDPGQCEGYFPAFAHNPKTGLCEPFVYGGCGGNRNRYSSRDACLEACPPIGDDWGKCAHDSDCTLIGTSCCGACDPVTDRDLIAINVLNRSRYGEWYCAETPPCLPCEPVAETEQTEKYFKPLCKNARCTLLDIRESLLNKCQEDSDCVLREGAKCCAECDGSGWVPVNKDADLCELVSSPCSDCTSQPPKNLGVRCTAGRCELEGPL